MNGTCAFRDDELVLRKQKVNGEWVESYFPRVGGRLRLAHEQNERLGIQTEVIRFDETCAVVKATVTTMKGTFCGFGTATVQRDQRLADSLLELAETRSIARGLRFSGYGVEYTGAEEISHVIPETEPNAAQNESKDSKPIFEPHERQDKPETKAPVQPKSGGNGNGGKATGAQCRALYALSKKARMCDEDVEGLLRPLNAARFEDLTIADASRLIQYFQTQTQAAA
ncbi:MAG: hypothetical protein FJY85_11545 [Deltaproteobacteria bacterium]|nr:hypothetical protein [Deltaproteobacteria bacterium]